MLVLNQDLNQILCGFNSKNKLKIHQTIMI